MMQSRGDRMAIISKLNSELHSRGFSKQTILSAILAFWLSASLFLDLMIMPSFYASGMMANADFATAGYTLFWIFNRVEILCAAFLLTGSLVLGNYQTQTRKIDLRVVLAALMLAIALVYTYGLTPQMTTLGLQLDLFNATPDIPATMSQLHGAYWFLEVLKIAAGGILVRLCSTQAADLILTEH
jgi:hypothetical protein